MFGRRFQGPVKTGTASRVPSGNFFVSVLVEGEYQISNSVLDTSAYVVGGDFGLHDLLVLSTGAKYGYPQWLESEWYRLKIRQRRLAKTARDQITGLRCAGSLRDFLSK